MTVDQRPHHENHGIDGSSRKAWAKPTLLRLRSGSAENVPGTTILDGPLETIGS